jgi:hypothetical protein
MTSKAQCTYLLSELTVLLGSFISLLALQRERIQCEGKNETKAHSYNIIHTRMQTVYIQKLTGYLMAFISCDYMLYQSPTHD